MGSLPLRAADPAPRRRSRAVADQAAARGAFQVSEKTVERWATAKMPCPRSGRGRTVRFRVPECESWLRGTT